MKTTRFNVLALALGCLMLAACGDDGETTKSSGAGGDSANSPQPGNQGQVQFGVPSVDVNESAGSATVTVTRTGGSDGAVSVRVTSRDGTATAADYTAVSATVSFAAGDTTAKTVTVPITNDTVDEPDETLYLTLGSPAGGVTIGAAREVLVTIVDDDIAAPAAPKAAMSSAYKQLRIDWAPVAAATSYRLLKDPTGSAGFAQVGTDLPASAKFVNFDVIVHKEDWLNARYVIAACNSAGCTNSNVLSAAGNSAALIGYLKASNTGRYDGFGNAVALSADGNTLAVSANWEQSAATGVGGNQASDCAAAPPVNCSTSSGAVYVFTRSGSTWSAPAYIKASNIGTTNTYDNFGAAVALSADGNTLAVGAPEEDSGSVGIGGVADETMLNSGAVYIYTRSGGSWSGPIYVKAPNPDSFDGFGESLALSADGSTLAVGAAGEDGSVTGIGGGFDNAALSAGAVYVYARSGAAWSASAYVKASNTSANALFGSSVDLSADGNLLAVGARGESSAASGIGGNRVYTCSAPASNCLSFSGAAYVYSRTAGTWSAVPVYVKASNPQQDAIFGDAVALSDDGSTLAVGASNEASAATGVDGNQTSGCNAAPIVNCAPYSGAAYVYSRSGSTWSGPTYIKASNTGEGDGFGAYLALSGDGSTLVVGAPYENGSAGGVGAGSDEASRSAGAAYLLTRSASGWSQPAYIKPSNPGIDHYFGSALALSADGSTMVVGADGEDSAATGLNGNQRDDCNAAAATNCSFDSGAVYSY